MRSWRTDTRDDLFTRRAWRSPWYLHSTDATENHSRNHSAFSGNFVRKTYWSRPRCFECWIHVTNMAVNGLITNSYIVVSLCFATAEPVKPLLWSLLWSISSFHSLCYVRNERHCTVMSTVWSHSEHLGRVLYYGVSEESRVVTIGVVTVLVPVLFYAGHVVSGAENPDYIDHLKSEGKRNNLPRHLQ